MEELINNNKEDSRELPIHYYMLLPKQIKGRVAELKPRDKNESVNCKLNEMPQGLDRGVTVISGKLNIPVFNIVN